MADRARPLALPPPDGDAAHAGPADGDPLAFTPVVPRHATHNGWTAKRQRGFIDALADTGSVQAACHAVGMQTGGAYRLRRAPDGAGFRAAWAAALDAGVQRVEDVAMDRALNGVEQPVYSYGKLVGTRVVHNDQLLMFVLRNRAGERFGSVGAKGAKGPTPAELDALKTRWREEYEADVKRRADEMREKLARDISAMRERLMADPDFEPVPDGADTSDFDLAIYRATDPRHADPDWEPHWLK